MTMHVTWKSLHRPLVLAALLVGGVAVLASGPVQAGSPVNTGYFGGVAIMGYDPVAYFTESRAVKGSLEFSHDWLGETWHFASAKHRDAFAAAPIKYAPQYGGYCALGVAYNEVSANIDPEVWRIVDGKLYLFFGEAGMEEEWDADPSAVVAQAETNWPGIEAKLTAE
jgi:YHS domain-containing protein